MAKSLGAGATSVWLIMASCLAVVVALEYSGRLPLTPTVKAAQVEKPAGRVGGMDLVFAEQLSSEALDEIVSRPLFSISRRPFEAAIEATPTLPRELARERSLELVGTMAIGDVRVALLKRPDDGLLRMRLGHEIEGWLIDEIGDSRIRLKKGDKVEWLGIRAGMSTSNDLGTATEVHSSTTPVLGIGLARNAAASPDGQSR